VSDLFADVARFNKACGVRLRPTPGWVSDDEIALAVRLIDEEREELAEALRAGDMIATADAIADSHYVRAGLVLRLGVARTYIQDLLVPSAMRPSWTDLVDREAVIADLEADDRAIKRAIQAGNLIEVDTYTHRTMYALTSLAVLLRIPLDAVWCAVQASNMSKVVDGKVIRDQGGKICKPPTFVPPDIADVLARHRMREAA
jgi:predicted HAD superfamily Cof-like phosphohydrolase